MVKLVRSMMSSAQYPLSYSLPNYIVGKASNLKFARAAAATASGSDKPQTSDKMDQDKDAKSGANKPLSGGGYAKRSDEEGFGALYGGNQSLSKDDEDKIVHANVPVKSMIRAERVLEMKKNRRKQCSREMQGKN